MGICVGDTCTFHHCWHNIPVVCPPEKQPKTSQKFCTFAGGNRKKEAPERGSPFLNTFFEKGLLFSGRELVDNCHKLNFWKVPESDLKFCTFTVGNRKNGVRLR